MKRVVGKPQGDVQLGYYSFGFSTLGAKGVDELQPQTGSTGRRQIFLMHRGRLIYTRNQNTNHIMYVESAILQRCVGRPVILAQLQKKPNPILGSIDS